MLCPHSQLLLQWVVSPNISRARREHTRQQHSLPCSAPVSLCNLYPVSNTLLLTRVFSIQQPLPGLLNCFRFHPSLPFHPAPNSSKFLSSVPSITSRTYTLCVAIHYSSLNGWYKGISCSRSAAFRGEASPTEFPPLSSILLLANSFFLSARFLSLSVSPLFSEF